MVFTSVDKIIVGKKHGGNFVILVTYFSHQLHGIWGKKCWTSDFKHTRGGWIVFFRKWFKI